MISQKLLIRLVASVACVAAFAAGTDAEAARWRQRRACCYETSCCDPCVTTCCAPVHTACCAPACERVCVSYRDPCTNACTRTCSYRVVDSCCMATVPACCTEVVVAAEPACCTAVAVAAAERPAGDSVVATPRTTATSVTVKR